MTTEQKIIRAKVGLLELAKQLGNVSQACKRSLGKRPLSAFSAASATSSSMENPHAPVPPNKAEHGAVPDFFSRGDGTSASILVCVPFCF
jgi:hypothetical protein